MFDHNDPRFVKALAEVKLWRSDHTARRDPMIDPRALREAEAFFDDQKWYSTRSDFDPLTRTAGLRIEEAHNKAVEALYFEDDAIWHALTPKVLARHISIVEQRLLAFSTPAQIDDLKAYEVAVLEAKALKAANEVPLPLHFAAERRNQDTAVKRERMRAVKEYLYFRALE